MARRPSPTITKGFFVRAAHVASNCHPLETPSQVTRKCIFGTDLVLCEGGCVDVYVDHVAGVGHLGEARLRGGDDVVEVADAEVGALDALVHCHPVGHLGLKDRVSYRTTSSEITSNRQKSCPWKWGHFRQNRNFLSCTSST